jgi:hypothetical protein
MIGIKIKDLGCTPANPTEAQGAQNRDIRTVMSRLTDLGTLPERLGHGFVSSRC